MYVTEDDSQYLNNAFARATPHGVPLTSANTYTYVNPTVSGMRSNISAMASRADSNDVTIFYLACHGDNYTTSGIYAGGLLLKDDMMYFYELANALNQIPGKVVVILSSCGSGAAIAADGSGEAAEFDAEAFSGAFIDAFAEVDRKNAEEQVQTATGELRVYNKFYVLAGSRNGGTTHHTWQYTQYDAVNEFVKWIYNSVCIGSNGYMAADTNRNNIITGDEMYNYLNGAGNKAIWYYNEPHYMYPDVYPRDASFPLLQKR